MGWLQRLLESVPAVQSNFNRAAYDAQIQPFTSRFNRDPVDFDGHKKAGREVSEPALPILLNVVQGLVAVRTALRWFGRSGGRLAFRCRPCWRRRITFPGSCG
jgi:hypothetical protein